MSTDTRKYERAAYKASKGETEFKNVEELSEIATNSPEEYNKTYLDKLFCPECCTPQLTLCKRQDGYYLRGYPKQEHLENCSLALDEVSDQSLVNTIKSNDEEDNRLIQQRLRLAIQRLIRNQNTEYHPLAAKENNGLVDLSLIKKSDIHQRTQKIIPCKSLTAPFSDDDFNKFMIFYGNVKINWDINKTYARLVIMRKGTNNIICSSLFAASKYDLKRLTNMPNYESAYLSMFTQIELKYGKDNRGPYRNFSLIDLNHLIIETE